MTKRVMYSNALGNHRMPWWNEDIHGMELKAMRMYRKKTLKEMSEETGYSIQELKEIENDKDCRVSPSLAGMYMIHLSCDMNLVYQFRSVIDGQATSIKESRTIGSKLKKAVRNKCDNKCSVCQSTENLNIHHIKPYAKGGLNELDNLTLLCDECHADAHEGEHIHALLKSKL